MNRHTRSLVIFFLLVGVLAVLLGTMVRRASVGDSVEALFPEPRERTQFRIRELERAVADFKRHHGEYPDSLRVLIPDPQVYDRAAERFDGWGHALKYTIVDRGYEIRSAGPDGQFGTPDDVVSGTQSAR